MANNSFCNHCPSRLATRIHYFILFKTRQGFLSLHNVFSIFSYLCIPLCVGKSVSFMVFTFLDNALNLGIFTQVPLPTQYSRENFLKIFFPQRQKKVEKTMICFIKIQSENMKMTRVIIMLSIFCTIYNFTKCMMTLQFCKQYLSCIIQQDIKFIDSLLQPG